MIGKDEKEVIHQLVRKELEREGFSVSDPTSKGRYRFLAERGGKSFPVIIRISASDWPQGNVDEFLDIERLADGTEKIRDIQPEPIPGLVYVLVRRLKGKDYGHRFFPIRWVELCKVDWKEHQSALDRGGQRRRDNPQTRETTIRMKDLLPYENRWDFIA